jgi:glutamyl-tRNA(Gln) amidotransferase subunit E
LIHSDSKGDTITSSDWLRVKKFVNAGEKDTLVIVWGSESDTDTAVKEIIIRAKEATEGIPSETRQALSDGTNGFERILPGADRMYPDTDLPPKKITEEKLNEIKSWLPEKLWIRQEWYKELGIPEDTISELSISRFAEVFKNVVNKLKINPTTAAVVLIQYPKRLKKLGFDIEQLNENIFEDIFVNHTKGLIPRDAVLSILYNVLQHKLAVKDVIPPPIKKESAQKEIKQNLKNFDTEKLYKTENKEKVLMGFVMKKLRGRIPATSVGEIIGLKKGEKKNGK